MKNLLINSLVFILVFLISIGILDVFVAATHISNVSYNDVYEDIGRGRRAGIDYVMFNEGFSIGQFNKHRYLGTDYTPEKSPNVFRIALLGDSYVEGFQVFDRDHFRSILENELSHLLGKKVEVLNFGRSGFDIGDMYCYNETFIREFKPDLSLYFIAQGDLKPKFTDPLRMKIKEVNGKLVVYKGFPEDYIKLYNRTKKLIQNSTILNMLNNGKKIAKTEGVLPILLDKFYLPFDNHITKNGHNDNPAESSLPEITKKILDQLDPSKDIIINRDILGQIPAFEEFIDEKSLMYIDLQDTLTCLKKSGIDPNYWKATKKYGHWNQAAHKAVALKLAHELAKKIQADKQ